MKNPLKTAALAFAASGLAIAAVPAAAADFGHNGNAGYSAAPTADGWDRDRRDRDNRWDRGRNDRRHDNRYYSRSSYGEPVYRDTRVWRGNNGAVHCQKKNGTTGLIIGGAAGALLGREVDGGRDRTLGTILGAAAGALIGKEVDGGTRCR
jgi:hypothetical protein